MNKQLGRCFVTGAAGFLGSHMVDFLLEKGHEVIGYDNFSTGKHVFLECAKQNTHFKLITADLLDNDSLQQSMQHCHWVFHFAANADVRFGLEHPKKDLEQNTVATFNVLESMRVNNIKNIVFSSTGSVYGEAKIIPTPEDHPFPLQTSLYGASKLAAEALIAAYCEGFHMQAYIFRLVSLLGERYTHGHIVDFYQQLKKDPSHLKILGDGHQKKSYIYVLDAIQAMWCALQTSNVKTNIFNVGTQEYSEVNDSIDWISDYLGLMPKRSYSGGERGWVGDNPFIFLILKKYVHWGGNLPIA